MSPDSKSLEYVYQFKLTRLRFYKQFTFTTRASASYEVQKALFLRLNIMDTHYDYYTTETVDGFRENVLLYNNKIGDFPWYADSTVYLLLTMVMMSWLQRIKFI
mmetsp:Transcript_38683/g.28555  ORF Transcript_38683/g.28555 Transcript_38683/m.28555 type:complete len:104 (+) Transcript_38683:567-878(+)